MAGWTHAKRVAIERAFYGFLDRCFVNSKDYGQICLGEHLFEGQRRFITAVFDSLENDIHDIYVLKSRQLGLSTIARALSIFLIGVHPGLKGAIVFDTDSNKVEARAEVEIMVKDLPPGLKFPRIKSSNRSGLMLVNDSKVLFMSAGVRQNKGSGTLGRSVGLSLAHCSELCSWDNEEGLEAFKNALSDVNPDRLYIWESTARGFNKWWEMWKDARKDPHCCCVFLGWWSKESQKIDRTDPDFLRYGIYPPTPKEESKIKDVLVRYGHQITPEQLAWVRRKMDPGQQNEGDSTPEFEGNPMRIQEQPWTEDDAFQQTGAVFFAPQKLTEQTNQWVSLDYDKYMFSTSEHFADTQVLRPTNNKMVELKVWEPPVSTGGVYVMGIDPAYGENETNDRSSIQILRCYADGIDQVAEYAWPLITTDQLGWVIAALLGWYGYGNNEVRYILELNGPGMAVFNSLKSLKYQIEHSRTIASASEQEGLPNVFKNVRTYIYSRADSMGAGYNWHMKTVTNLKVTFMERLRDYTQNGLFHIRSLDLIEEMKTVAREGDSIGSPGSMKDDRVLAAAIAIHYWDTKIRNDLISQRRTRQAEAAKQTLQLSDQVYLFNQNMLETVFKQKMAERHAMQAADRRIKWRGR